MESRWLIIVGAFLLWEGCAYIQPPDGGPPDREAPQLRRVRILRGGKVFILRWNEYLAPASELSAIGLWFNPPLPFQARLRGKVIRLRLDTFPSLQVCPTLWGGPGIKDFTENNPLPPTLLWQSCPTETLSIQVPLAESKTDATIWLHLYCGDDIAYRFLSWQGEIKAHGLSPGFYTGWAWEDADRDGQWSIQEIVWFPPSKVFQLPADTLYPWVKYRVDTFPPAAPKVMLYDSLRALLFFPEPVWVQSGPATPLSETVLLVEAGDSIVVSDSAGSRQGFRFKLGEIDTQAYRSSVYWHASINAQTPLLYLRWIDTLTVRDTFWIARQGEKIFTADACILPGEIWLSPLPTDGEVETHFRTSREETISVKLPARKVPFPLPQDSVAACWRIYFTPLHRSGNFIEGAPGDTVWLPPSAYGKIGILQKDGFWQPVAIERGKPYLAIPPAYPFTTLDKLKVAP